MSCLLLEVLSDCTARIDRLAKHAAYTGISDLQTYLIVDQKQRRVCVYQRTGMNWSAAEVAGHGSVDTPCLGTVLTLDQIYRASPI